MNYISKNFQINFGSQISMFLFAQGVVEGQHFYQATQNGARTAIVFARQSKTHILKSSGF